jgi:hypothetical protein
MSPESPAFVLAPVAKERFPLIPNMFAEVLMSTLPPLPAEIRTPPPFSCPAPASRAISPPEPELVVPVFRVMEPLFPVTASPVVNATLPDTCSARPEAMRMAPDDAPAPDAISTSPETEVLEVPEIAEMLPPVAVTLPPL